MLGPESPCTPWITEDDLCCDPSTFKNPPSPQMILDALDAATQYLYDRTCRRWPGLCTATVRPCAPCRCGNASCCDCRYTHVELTSAQQIASILNVTMDGVALPVTDYRLDQPNKLVLQSPATITCFPRQNLDLVDGAVGTWSVQYEFGKAPISLAKLAAGDLACELLRACGGEDCKLPDGIVSLTRQGVTMQFRGPQDGYTNIERVDLLINEYRCKRRNRLIDPDRNRLVYRGV